VRADVVVLARYMQVLSADFIAAWPNRIIKERVVDVAARS
jgi:formyltetrahydrofolate hydrolase